MIVTVSGQSATQCRKRLGQPFTVARGGSQLANYAGGA